MDSSLALPSGVVTFLMTDIQGSTRLWEREPDTMRVALQRHDAVVAEHVHGHHGHVVKSKGEGDSVFAVFEHARDAVGAAVLLQRALARERWPTSTPLRVRMAIHTGQIDVHQGDYNGQSVNRCARLRSLATGGQVLMSGVTAELTKSQLPSGAQLTDLGTQQLKDLSAPERVWELSHAQMSESATASTETGLARGAGGAPAQANRPAFMLTDQQNRSADGREWGPRIRQVATGLLEDGIKCYTSVNLAALLNAQYERTRMPRLWEASVDQEPIYGDATVVCRDVTTARQVPVPALTGLHHARFAVLCARAAYGDDSTPGGEFDLWAEGWLNGQDRSGIQAGVMAAQLEADADRGTVVGHPEGMMAANATRAAMHAARLSFLGGRAHAEENLQAIHFATEAVRTALRMTRLDLPTLADQAVQAARSGR